MESIRLFGKYVIPHFNKRATISHGAFGAEARNGGRVLGRGKVRAEAAAGAGAVAGDIEAVFDGDRDAMEHTYGLGVLFLAGFGEGLIGEDSDEGVDLGIDGFDLAEVSFDELDGGDDAITEEGGHCAEGGAMEHGAGY